MPWTGPVFPSLTLMTFPRKRSPAWSAVPQESLSGKRTRYSLYSYPIWKYVLPISGLRTDAAHLEWQTFAGFVNSLNGTVGLFGYTDIVDNAVVGQSFGTGNGVATGPFPLVRTIGGFSEPIFLLNGAPSIYVGGVLQTLTTNYTIDAYGNVTFTVPPANGAALTWTGSFYWPCRFDDDMIDMNMFVANIFEAQSIKFSTEKLP
jgi:Conserved hypothetical protein 2217 (DUF2460)